MVEVEAVLEVELTNLSVRVDVVGRQEPRGRGHVRHRHLVHLAHLAHLVHLAHLDSANAAR